LSDLSIFAAELPSNRHCRAACRSRFRRLSYGMTASLATDTVKRSTCLSNSQPGLAWLGRAFGSSRGREGILGLIRPRSGMAVTEGGLLLGGSLWGTTLQAPAAQPAFHALILLFARFRRRADQANAPIQSVFDLPILAVIRTRQAVTAPIDVVLHDNWERSCRGDGLPPYAPEANESRHPLGNRRSVNSTIPRSPSPTRREPRPRRPAGSWRAHWPAHPRPRFVG
jgi:hypothetical protein